MIFSEYFYAMTLHIMQALNNSFFEYNDQGKINL